MSEEQEINTSSPNGHTGEVDLLPSDLNVELPPALMQRNTLVENNELASKHDHYPQQQVNMSRNEDIYGNI